MTENVTRYKRSSYKRKKHVVKKRHTVKIVILSFIALLFVFSLVGTLATGSSDYLDVSRPIAFYSAIWIDVIQLDVQHVMDVAFDLERLNAYFEKKGVKVSDELKSKQIEQEKYELDKKAQRDQMLFEKNRKLEREHEILIHAYINEERVNHGLEPLYLDKAISMVARGHSKDMLINDYYSHVNQLSQDPTDRADILGVKCIKNDSTGFYGLAENIHTMTGHVEDVLDNSKYFVDGWMNSPGHRENILTADFDRIGIGVSHGNSEIYATQNFC